MRNGDCLTVRQDRARLCLTTKFTGLADPTRVNVEKPKTVNEGNDAEKPKREPAPVQRFC